MKETTDVVLKNLENTSIMKTRVLRYEDQQLEDSGDLDYNFIIGSVYMCVFLCVYVSVCVYMCVGLL